MAASKKEKTKVLVVDDSRVMRKAIERVLSSEFELVEADAGHRVQTVYDSQRAWPLLQYGRRLPDMHRRIVQSLFGRRASRRGLRFGRRLSGRIMRVRIPDHRRIVPVRGREFPIRECLSGRRIRPVVNLRRRHH